ncbi:hypothetical protein V5799_033517 [Amblyomma americanum]|uniref:Uncharacterized protein n=1 Tax=Amblyomma americanum TaxID=6943 RepID=A0AAQ4DN39_AMBAM
MKSAAKKPPADSANWRMACHNFVSQDVFVTQDKDIVAMCAAKDKLLIATSRMSVEVRDLNSKGLLLFAFPTTDQVQMIEFCEGANFVLALEKKMTRSVDVLHVRAYFNWWVEPCNQVPKTREAGSEPQCNGTPDRRLEIVELPTKRHGVSCIGCCRQSGTTLVAAGDAISVFVLKAQYDKTRRQLYNDFERLMTLKISFHPTSVNVCEDHVACCSHSEILVFKIKLEAEVKSLESSTEAATGSQKKKHVSFSTKESSLIDDQSHISLKFESEDNIEWADASGEEELKAVLHPACFPVELTLKSASMSHKNEDSDIVILGPRVNPPAACKVGVIIDPDTDLISSADEVSTITLLYRKLCAKDGGNLIAFHWVPYYINDSMSHPLTEAMSAVPKTVSFALHSRIFTKLKTLACLVSSGKCGYLYKLSGTPRLSVLSAKKLKPVSPTLANTILEIVWDECPEYLHKLVLCSGIAAFCSEKALSLLKKNIAYRQGQGHAADSLAVVHLLLRDGNMEAAKGILKTLSKEFLMPVLLELHDLVHWSQSITQLGEMIKATRPDVYFSLLVHLKNNGVMSPEQIVLILQHASPQAEPHCVPLLREFLEATLSSKRTNAQAYPHLLVTLVKTYLGKMAPYSGSGSPQQAPLQLVHTKSSTLFGNRHPWLLELPPFLGRAITKTCNQYSTTMNLAECCICSSCWDELLRMQSLLCSDLPSASLRSQVLELLEKFSLSESENYISVKVLCLPPTKALSILLKSYPSAVLGFMETKFPEDSSEWVSLYTAVSNKLQAASKKKKAAVYKSIMEGVLSYLSDALTPEQLVDLLPPGKQEYTDYVRQCMERYQAKLLREKIIALGTELKDMM